MLRPPVLEVGLYILIVVVPVVAYRSNRHASTRLALFHRPKFPYIFPRVSFREIKSLSMSTRFTLSKVSLRAAAIIKEFSISWFMVDLK